MGEKMRCPLCGCEFDAGELACHSSCAFNRGCAIVCCPNCGYQMADESRLHLTRFVRRLVGREANVQWTGARPLSTLRAGESGTVVSVDARQEQLSVFGLIPGARVTLEQRQPAYVLRVGFTELSVERDVAERIVVETA